MSEANASYSKYTTLYKRRKTLVLHIGTKWRCFILWSDSGTMLHLKRRFYEALCAKRKVWSGTLCHEAHLRCMKRSLFRLHVFCPFGQKNGRGCFNCSENISQAQNVCKLAKNGYRFAKLRKYLCFQNFWKQRKIFYSTKRIFSPKQTQDAPKKDSNLRLLFFVEWKIKQRQPHYRQTPRIYTLPSTEVIKFLWFIFLSVLTALLQQYCHFSVIFLVIR